MFTYLNFVLRMLLVFGLSFELPLILVVANRLVVARHGVRHLRLRCGGDADR